MLLFMTTHLNPRRRRIAAVAAIFMASASVMMTSAAAADAQPVTDFTGYNQCMQDQRNMYRKPDGTIAPGDLAKARFDCCITWGGTWGHGTFPKGWCDWPADSTGGAGSLPTRVASLPADATEMGHA